MKSNVEKIVLLLAVLLLAACVYFSLSNFKSRADEVTSINRPDGVFTSTPAEVAELAKKSIAEKQLWISPRIYDESTKLNLFVSRPILVPVQNPDPLNPVVIDDPQSKPLHEPIPNSWWLEHRLPYIYADALLRDPDGDGFTNLEEYENQTSPIDAASRPDVTRKIVLGEISSSAESYNYNGYSGGKAIFYVGKKDANGNFRRSFSEILTEVGQRFGSDAKPNRYEVISLDANKIVLRDHEKQEDARNAMITLPFKEFYDVLDYSAVVRFTLFTPTGSSVTVEEGAEFAFSDLPDYQFRLASLDLERSTALIEELNPDGTSKRSFLVGQNGPE